MVTHYIITNREVTSRKSKSYISVNEKEFMRMDGDEEARHNLRYGTVSFDPKKAKKLKDFKIQIIPEVAEATLKEYTEGSPVSKAKFPSGKIFDELYEAGSKAKSREDILVFVHGFKSDLETAMQTLCELHQKYVEPKDSPICHIVLFTWPAKKHLLKYRSDAYDASQSGFALARSMASLREYFKEKLVKEKKPQCEQKIHLLCHSMGNRVLESMIAGLADIGLELNTLFGEIILVGSDIDYDALERPKPMYRLIDLGERIHVYFHNKDQALGVSEITKNAFNRLGRWGAKNTMNLPDDIYQCDVSDIEDDNGLLHEVVHHWYYTNSESVIQDITAVFWGRNSIFNF
ncbi:alpha/beta hydrolase [Algoriphagus halophilus]|uniref:Esterase/lipase superfamily enzyme n=1 Tax=Algoriphagus halophilus TaxID=226505 RepID=A0A1N6DQB2_9BACT|nr:alpha/beta hydrolase [Algoriphagus halophilus]SIN72936.1 Esterase/lipase superfamily enzyme [Algoriphagus halophilus]